MILRDFERILQYLAAAAFIVAVLSAGIFGTSLWLYVLSSTRFWWLAAAYGLWIWVLDRDVSERGGRPSMRFRSSIWFRHLQNYFPLRLEKTPGVRLDPKRNYLFCCFPHGLFPLGVFGSFGSRNADYDVHCPDHRPSVATLKQAFYVPFYRELVLAAGGVACSSRSIEHVLGSPEGGRVCVVTVGGAAEAYFCRPGSYSIVLRRRRGFVRLALKNGAPLVPVLSFGETDLFDQVEGRALRYFQEVVRRWLGVALILPIGRGFLGIVPRRCPITTLIGRPVDVPKIPDATDDVIEEYHRRFVEALTQMFEEEKYKYLENPEDKVLKIF